MEESAEDSVTESVEDNVVESVAAAAESEFTVTASENAVASVDTEIASSDITGLMTSSLSCCLNSKMPMRSSSGSARGNVERMRASFSCSVSVSFSFSGLRPLPRPNRSSSLVLGSTLKGWLEDVDEFFFFFFKTARSFRILIVSGIICSRLGGCHWSFGIRRIEMAAHPWKKDPAKAESFIVRLIALIKFNPWRLYGCTVGSVFEVSSRIFASKTTKALPLFRPCGSDDRSSVNQKTVP
ncbi:hypothetical protein MHI43_03555 [Paenibacillus sp. FSL H8-0457]|uniref:hypothetical protein n=1 Tax=Bacillales TaxID=1385 RepID=UPI00030C331B|nr:MULTISPECIES: hypothetical protein [Paenibacillus]MCM3261620.1 hypothetical protein [Paenibacillus lautus]